MHAWLRTPRRHLLTSIAVIAALGCGVAGCGRRTAPPKPPLPPPESPPRRAVRPASVPAPTKDQPIVLWHDTKAPINDWHGDLAVAYERRPALRGETPTLAISLDLGAAGRGKRRKLYVYAKQPLSEVRGYLDLSPALRRMRGTLAMTCPNLSGKTVLSVSVGGGERDNYFPLSNQLTIRCLFTPAPNTPQ